MQPSLESIRAVLGIPEGNTLTQLDGPDGQPIVGLEIVPESYPCRNELRWLEFRLEDDGQVLIAPRGQKLRMPVVAFRLLVAGVLAASAYSIINEVEARFYTNVATGESTLPASWHVIVTGTRVLKETSNEGRGHETIISFEIQTSPEGHEPLLVPDPEESCLGFLEEIAEAIHFPGTHIA